VMDAFGPPLATQVQGLAESGVRVLDPRIGCGVTGGSVDRCSMMVPVGASTLQWELVWDTPHSTEPPDIIFHDGCPEFVRFEDLPAVDSYDVRVPQSTKMLVDQVRAKYCEMELEAAKSYPDERVQFELSTVSDWPGLQAGVTSGVGPTEVHLVLPLSIGPDDVSGNSPVMLHVVLQPGSTRVPVAHIINEHEHEWLLGYTLPGWSQGTCTMEYTVIVQDGLTTWYARTTRRVELQRAYFDALAQLFGSPLERNADKIAFHFVHDGFVVIVHFQTWAGFPDCMPDIVIQTLHNTRNGKCFRSTYNSYPYSPRWTPQELAERNRCFLLETLPSYKSLVQQQSWH